MAVEDIPSPLLLIIQTFLSNPLPIQESAIIIIVAAALHQGMEITIINGHQIMDMLIAICVMVVVNAILATARALLTLIFWGMMYCVQYVMVAENVTPAQEVEKGTRELINDSNKNLLLLTG